jgi:fructose-1,6-bisphosphatase/inositol monophosphatase family enzyme
MVRMDAAAEEFAIGLARRAGELMRTNFSLGTKKTWKEDNSPLTVTDLAINEVVVEEIQATYPDHAVIGEEESHGDTVNSEWVWVCDPVDGTIPFSHGFPTFAFSLALTRNGHSVLGVVYDAFLDRLVVAREGNGATLNGVPVTIGDFESIERTTMGLEASRLGMTGESLRSSLRALGCHPVTFNSFVYEGMLCAIGEFSAAVYGYQHPWDAAALDVVIREAGGVVSNLRGEPNTYRGPIEGFVAAANAQLHHQILDLIRAEYP